MAAVKLSQILENKNSIAALVSGSIASAKATVLATARSIDGLSFNGSADINHYSTCATVAATAAKVATLSGYSLQTGGRSMIKFTYANTAATPTLNINATGAKAIKAFGTTDATIQWLAGDVVEFIYDGTNYIMLPSMGMMETMDASVDALNNSLNAPTVGQFIYDYQNGVAGYNTESDRGADTFHPFKSAIVNGNVLYTTVTALSLSIPAGVKEIYVACTQSMSGGTFYGFTPSGTPYVSNTIAFVKQTLNLYPAYSQITILKITLNGTGGTLILTPTGGTAGSSFNLVYNYFY